MATVFMKWLENKPGDYDRGIKLLTLGRAKKIRQHILDHLIQPDMNVLEIGCGTGTLSVGMTQKSARVTAIDASPDMLAEAEAKASQAGVLDRLTLMHLDATMIEDAFKGQRFDLIVSTLVFSELPKREQTYVLQACHPLLKPGGRLVIADEVVPAQFAGRVLYGLIRAPLVLLTWLLTRTTTHGLKEFGQQLTQSGYISHTRASYLGGSLVIYEAAAVPVAKKQLAPAHEIPQLQHQITLRSVLIDLWSLFFRIIPPYPKVIPGLYKVGDPDPDSPVLVTGNFDLTVRRLVRAIDGKIDAFLLVADSAGINVWCAAGGGFFTAEKVIAALKSTHLADVVNHHNLILPQLCANGVDGWRIRKETGWGVHWGPARASDIPAYLAAHRKKTIAMRRVCFPLLDRLEMVTVTLGFYSLLILVPVVLFWRSHFWQVAGSLAAISYFYALVHPWLPGRDGLSKSIPLILIVLGVLFGYHSFINPLPLNQLFNWAIGLTGLSFFTSAELQGMSPLMRGEQANWSWEAVVGIALGLIYWVIPSLLGWR